MIEKTQDLVALAEKCGAEIGRLDGQMAWAKFHKQSSLEAFATGVAMRAAVRSHLSDAQKKEGWNAGNAAPGDFSEDIAALTTPPAAAEAPAVLDALSVDCPHCWQKAGEPCIWPETRQTNRDQPHEDRKAAARAALATPTDSAVNAGAVPSDLHPRTAALADSFAAALKEKLAAAEKKYGYSDGWAYDEWKQECASKLLDHVAKGDPRDVAAYCAFMWHHGWSTAPALIAERDSSRKLLASRGEALEDALNRQAVKRAILGRALSTAEPQADAGVSGLPIAQESKYTVNGSHIINRASGEAIPHDEPVFIFRARDKYAAGVIGDYCAQFCNDPAHAAAVEARFIQFSEWAEAHPERMKEPDTHGISPAPKEGEL